MPKRGQRPSISIIGAGRLGGALAVALVEAGYKLDAVVTATKASARRISTELGRQAVVFTASQLDRLPQSDLTLISTPDDVIPSVAQQLAEPYAAKQRGRIFLHTSGALSSTVLTPLSRKGSATGSLHPLVSVSRANNPPKFWKGVFWCIEGNRAAVQAAKQIVINLRGQSFTIAAAKKPLYHAAAVTASSHVVALFEIAISMLVQAGLSEEKAREVLLPLLKSTVSNLASFTPARALTGPVVRGDVATVETHLRALGIDGLEDALAVYRILAEQSLRLMKASKNNRHALNALQKILHKKSALTDR